nr:hypothetical protein [Deltaproteobacteria bacterium]
MTPRLQVDCVGPESDHARPATTAPRVRAPRREASAALPRAPSRRWSQASRDAPQATSAKGRVVARWGG